MTAQQGRKWALRYFMKKNYSNERLAMLLAHAQSGKLAYASCCCFLGVATADHVLRGELPCIGEYMGTGAHLDAAMFLPGADVANQAYKQLGQTDEARRRIVIPIIRAEFKRRETVRAVDAKGLPACAKY